MASDNAWDQTILANPDISQVNSVVEMLVDQLAATPLDPATKRDYALAYIALARGNDQEMAENADGYSSLLVSYAEKAGLREFNTGRYAVMMFHACLVRDNKTIDLLMSKKPDLGYLDSFPGVLRDLVKRRVLDDSTVKMDRVAATYPLALVKVLRSRLNYRDLARLALDSNPAYDGYRQAIFEDLASVASESYIDILDNRTHRTLGIYPNFSSFPALSVVPLIDEMLRLNPNYPLTMDKVANLASVLSAMTPSSADIVPSAISYVTSRSEYPTNEGGMASAMVSVAPSAIPTDAQGVPLPLATGVTPSGEVIVQRFRLQLTESYLSDAWRVA